MPDAVKAVGQNVLQEPPGKLAGGERHDPVSGLAVLAIVLDPERHALAVIGCDPAVRDRDPVGIAGEIGEDLVRPGERLLGIDDPVAPALALQEERERFRVCQRGEIAVEAELAGGMEAGEPLAHQPAEQAREYPHGQEEAAATVDPALAIR